MELTQIKTFEEADISRYRELLSKKKGSLILKRAFDILCSLILLLILSPVMLILSVMIVCDSKGGVFYRQERVTTNGKIFKIFKFRTMVKDADKKGTLVTVGNDARITRVGKLLRKARLDEFPQLINVLKGEMSFVGTRPEVKKYVDRYTEEMYATLLMPAGITSTASIMYKDEDEILNNCEDVDETYVTKVLPEKMKYNLEYIENFNFFYDIKIMFQTFWAVIK